jgi:hypothetical protein
MQTKKQQTRRRKQPKIYSMIRRRNTKKIFNFYQALSKKKVEQEKAEAEQIKQIKEKSAQLAMTIANGLFQLQQQNLNNQLQEIQYNQAQELASAGDNEQAKATINAKFAKETAEIKRKQAVADKEQAIFNIGISTASAVIKQAAATPLPGGISHLLL